MSRSPDDVHPPMAQEAVFVLWTTVAAVLLMVATVLVIWLAAVPWGPIVCAAISSPAPHCIFENRVGTGAVVTVVVVAVGLATASASILRRRGHRLGVRVGLVLLAILLFIAYPVVAWSPGFPLAGAGAHGQSAQADPAGRWVSEDGGEAYLLVTAVGRLEGFDGCNGFSGSWSRSDAGGLIVFDDTVMSLMMCDGVDDWLTRGRFAVSEDDRLRILDESHTTIGTLVRD
ncbi:META domain-containing protein [Microbacterium sp. SD291]|uniref:META domain-containing protein n=1 Tax=Microbacterium sp. SD291 TaxID=2782007 RepID=UPI001A97A2B0|nr:META domain-containing protein [Microbacterium sp. SD291]MBO0980691.1 META domain-containing protein [Microbacterium sp. SD291]